MDSSLRRFLIMNSSEYAPDSLGARGVANPGASFFDREGNFFARKMRPDVRAFARANPHETAKAQMPRKTRSARPLLPASASIVESRIPVTLAKKSPLSRLNVPRFLPLSQPLTRSTSLRIHPLDVCPPPHHKSASTASLQTKDPNAP